MMRWALAGPPRPKAPPPTERPVGFPPTFIRHNTMYVIAVARACFRRGTGDGNDNAGSMFPFAASREERLSVVSIECRITSLGRVEKKCS
jgi:hypothetical protein